MRHACFAATIAALAFGASYASAATATLDFENGTDQGFGGGFGNDASASFPIVNIGGSNRLQVPTTGFQVAGRETSNPADPFFLALQAASLNETGYTLSYDYYVVPGSNPGTYFQMGTYFNTGSGFYVQDFPNTGKDVDLNGAQLAGGVPLTGTVTETFFAKYGNIPDGETFFRPGFIVNGDGTNNLVYIDNVRVAPVPEPTSIAAIGATVTALAARRRRSV